MCVCVCVEHSGKITKMEKNTKNGIVHEFAVVLLGSSFPTTLNRCFEVLVRNKIIVSHVDILKTTHMKATSE